MVKESMFPWTQKWRLETNEEPNQTEYSFQIQLTLDPD